jgi:hypothetical protein
MEDPIVKNKEPEVMLSWFRKEASVNRQRKKALRKPFATKPGTNGLGPYGHLKKASLVAAIAAVLCTALILPGLIHQVPEVNAAELHVNDNISLVPNPEETVEKYLQALIRRDEECAKSLLSFKAEAPLTVSNPHPSGYRILSSGKEYGKAYVEAEMQLQYTANPYYQIIQYRYELSMSEDEYRIDKITETNKIEVIEQTGTIVMYVDGGKKGILKLQDIPERYIGSSHSYRLSSLIYLESSNKLILAIHHMNEAARSISAALLSYDGNKESFELIDRVEAVKGSVCVSGLSLDPEGKYLAADIELESGDVHVGSIYVYRLADKSRLTLDTLFQDAEAGTIHSLYWTYEGLIFEMLRDGQIVNYLYKPESRSAVQTMIAEK